MTGRLLFNYREKRAVCSAVAVLGLLAVIEWGVLPVMNHRESLKQAIAEKTKALEEIEGLQQRHAAMIQGAAEIRNRLAQRGKGFTLFSYLDRSAENAGVKDHIAYMKPSGSNIQKDAFKAYQVEVKLQAVSLHQLSAFIYDVETADALVQVKKASIVKAGGQPSDGVDAVLWVETLAS